MLVNFLYTFFQQPSSAADALWPLGRQGHRGCCRVDQGSWEVYHRSHQRRRALAKVQRSSRQHLQQHVSHVRFIVWCTVFSFLASKMSEVCDFVCTDVETVGSAVSSLVSRLYSQLSSIAKTGKPGDEASCRCIWVAKTYCFLVTMSKQWLIMVYISLLVIVVHFDASTWNNIDYLVSLNSWFNVCFMCPISLLIIWGKKYHSYNFSISLQCH